MGLIREPEGVDFVIQSKPLTEKQQKELSEYIAKRKLEIKKRRKKSTYTQHAVQLIAETVVNSRLVAHFNDVAT